MHRTSSDSHDRVNAEDSTTRSSPVSGGDAAKIFAAAEHALDGVAVAVDVRREAVFPAPIKLAEREGFEPSVPVTQYARLATPRRFANGVTSTRLLKTIPTMGRWLGSSTAIPPSLAESH